MKYYKCNVCIIDIIHRCPDALSGSAMSQDDVYQMPSSQQSQHRFQHNSGGNSCNGGKMHSHHHQTQQACASTSTPKISTPKISTAQKQAHLSTPKMSNNGHALQQHSSSSQAQTNQLSIGLSTGSNVSISINSPSTAPQGSQQSYRQTSASPICFPDNTPAALQYAGTRLQGLEQHYHPVSLMPIAIYVHIC